MHKRTHKIMRLSDLWIFISWRPFSPSPKKRDSLAPPSGCTAPSPRSARSIRKLESDLGEVLFERSARDGTLTAAGEVLRDYARRMLNARAEAASAMEELKSLDRGRLLIAANEYTCLYLLPVLDRFRRLCPQIGVSIQRSLASRIPDDLLQRTVEIGILSFRPEGDLFKSIAVYTDELAFVVNPDHPLAREKGVAIEDLGAESFIAHNVPSPLRRQVVAAFAKAQDAAEHGGGAAQPGGGQALRRHGQWRGVGSRIDGGARARQRRTGPGAGGSAAF